MAGRARKRANALRCSAVRADGVVCGNVAPAGWDYCVVHAERRGEELLRENPERLELMVTLPRFAVPLGGWSRSEWEGVRLCMSGFMLPPAETFNQRKWIRRHGCETAAGAREARRT